MHLLNDTNKQSLNIYLQSENATTTINESSKIFYLDETIKAQPGERVLIGLTNLEIPYSFYNINTNINDEITFSTINGSYTVKLEPQNYDAEYLAEQLTLILGGQENILGGIITVEFNNRSNKYKFSSSVEFNITNSSINKELGLTEDVFNVLNYQSPNVCNLGGISNIYVRLTNLGLKNLDSRGQISNVIATIPVDSEPTFYIFFTPPEYLYFMINESYFNYLHIELTDDYGNDLILNGGSFTLTLTIHFQYQRDAVMKNQYLLDNKNNNLDYEDYINDLKNNKLKLKKKNKKKVNK